MIDLTNLKNKKKQKLHNKYNVMYYNIKTTKHTTLKNKKQLKDVNKTVKNKRKNK